VTQSSHWLYGPYEAVDGKLGYEWNHFDAKSCVSTAVETSPWLELDLGSVQNISTIVHHARRCDRGCDAQSLGFSIFVDHVQYASNVKMETGEVRRFPIHAAGRVIRVVNPGDEKVVTLCELEVNVVQSPDAAGHYVSRPAAEALALKHTAKLLAIAPDFHATNIHTATAEVRAPPPQQASQGRAYKAVVVLFLEGGADSFNMVVPHGGDGTSSDCKKPKPGGGRARKDVAVEYEEHDLFQEYVLERSEIHALTKAQLLPIDVPGDTQPCRTFGLHPSMKRIQALYNDGDAALVANMGALVEPLTLDEWNTRNWVGAKKAPPGVFAHNIMQKNAWTVHAEDRDAKGMLGRMVTKLTNKSQPMKSAMYSLAGYQRMLTGAPFTPDIINAGEGIVRFGDYGSLADDIVAMSGHESESLLVCRPVSAALFGLPRYPLSRPATTRPHLGSALIVYTHEL
jgi:hypothetical protein